MPERITRSLGELASLVGGVVRGDPQRTITGVSGLAEARPGDLAFYNSVRYRHELAATRASAVVVAPGELGLVRGPDALSVANPGLAFARISVVFHPRPAIAPGLDPRAAIEEGAQIASSAAVMAFSFVGRGARVGERAVVYPQVYVGGGATIGEDAILYPGVIVREGCSVGARAILQPGVAIGGDGFGFAFDPAGPEHFKIPQVGTIEVQDDVEIGANSAIDRATSGQTVIGRGSKLDNLVQIGHNVQVGELCILCGQVGIAGSSELGAGVVCGGQVGIADHVRVAARTRLGGQSGLKDDVTEAGDFLGSPMIPTSEFARAHIAFRKGPELRRTVHQLEKRVAELEARLAQLEAPRPPRAPRKKQAKRRA